MAVSDSEKTQLEDERAASEEVVRALRREVVDLRNANEDRRQQYKTSMSRWKEDEATLAALRSEKVDLSEIIEQLLEQLNAVSKMAAETHPCRCYSPEQSDDSVLGDSNVTLFATEAPSYATRAAAMSLKEELGEIGLVESFEILSEAKVDIVGHSFVAEKYSELETPKNVHSDHHADDSTPLIEDETQDCIGEVPSSPRRYLTFETKVDKQSPGRAPPGATHRDRFHGSVANSGTNDKQAFNELDCQGVPK